ncbi:MAG TPA: P-loop NTPase fold protein, partial [Terriglobia bacterium]|nr:P-loop NTPase fold protein [Terriglobia bacterium]
MPAWQQNANLNSGTGGMGTAKMASQENMNSVNQTGDGGLGIADSEDDENEGISSENAQGAVNVRFDQFRREEFSELALQILDVARRMGDGRPRPQVSVRRLLSAMVLSGLRRKGDERTGSWLVSLIPQKREEILDRILERYPAAARLKGSFNEILKSNVTVSEEMTRALLDIIETAKHLATEARPGVPVVVGTRHLLGAAVRQDEHETTARKTLRELGLELDEVRQKLIEQLPVWGLDDDQDAWRQVLEAVVAEVEHRLPTYAADSAVGPDLIGIKTEVEAMASLVSAWSVEPPLSIGLFGEWGSGKSFFMQKMKERVKQIAIEARKSNQ